MSARVLHLVWPWAFRELASYNDCHLTFSDWERILEAGHCKVLMDGDMDGFDLFEALDLPTIRMDASNASLYESVLSVNTTRVHRDKDAYQGL